MEENTRDRENTETSAGTQQSATKRHNEQDGRSDLHPEAQHSHARKARPSQCEYVVEKICPKHKNDKDIDLSTMTNRRDLTTIP